MAKKKTRGAKKGAKRAGKKVNPLSTAPVTKSLSSWITRARKALTKFPELATAVDSAERFLEVARCPDKKADGSARDHVPIQT